MKNGLIGKDPDAGKDWRQGGEGEDRGWDGWMASPVQWTWVWTSSGRWWRTWGLKELDTTEWLNNNHLGHHKVMSRVPCTIYYVLIQFSSVAQSCPTLWDPMDCSTPGFPVHHQLPELTQTHVHWVNDAIQPSHPVIPFSSCFQSFPASGSFQMSQFFVLVPQNRKSNTPLIILHMNYILK